MTPWGAGDLLIAALSWALSANDGREVQQARQSRSRDSLNLWKRLEGFKMSSLRSNRVPHPLRIHIVLCFLAEKHPVEPRKDGSLRDPPTAASDRVVSEELL